MIRTYKFDYNLGEASAIIKVDTSKFTADSAQKLLAFFTWTYDEDADPIDELMDKYAIHAIRIATLENYNLIGTKNWFADTEGLIAMDGSQGVELIEVERYEFDMSRLERVCTTSKN